MGGDRDSAPHDKGRRPHRIGGAEAAGADRSRPFGVFLSRPRFTACVLTALLGLLVLPGRWPWSMRAVIAWDVAAFLYLLLTTVMFVRSTTADLHRRAAQVDGGATAVLVFTIAAAAASLGAIGVELAGIHAENVSAQALRLTLTVATIVCSWFFVHTIFAVHYAHVHYDEAARGWALRFPHEPEPDYWDFVYFSFTIGAASQTSDVSVTSRALRRVVVSHTIVSFFFNATLLALVINVGAGLL